MSMMEYSRKIANWNPKERTLHRCKICKFETTSMFFMINHAKRHQLGVKRFSCDTNSVEIYCCTDCNFTNEITTVFREHIRTHLVPETEGTTATCKYTCANCDFGTHSVFSLFKHVSKTCLRNSITKTTPQLECLSKQQSGIGRSKKSVIWFRCHKCNYKSKQKGHLARHIQCTHLEDHEIQWYRCVECEYKSKREDHLKQHIQNRHNECEWSKSDKYRLRSRSGTTRRHDEYEWPQSDKYRLRSHSSSTRRHNECEWPQNDKYRLRSHSSSTRKHNECEWSESHKYRLRSRSSTTRR